MKMLSAFIGLGGNIGDPQESMANALKLLDTSPGASVGIVSSLYRTPPWGKTDQPDFLNAAAEIVTSLSPRELLDLCLETERQLKRVRSERWGPRTVDIDILKYGERSVSEEGLEIPHPRMLDRAFVLLPLAEIAPQLDLAGESASSRARKADSKGIVMQPGGGGWWRGSGAETPKSS
ncbi:MAG: 2-amino-4-hydroxy-6-hydroxymethyldihydropteridine diphosphokinase [Rhizobiaceae bacterium]|nr:2-amino-4-hydroxy-6-hydroxymethyldihydropteridine diphosphokinase [Rhizobiaceae bacterium]